MRHPYHRPLLIASLLLGFALAVRAQNYRPFGPGRTYHFREAATVAGGADSLYTFRVDSVGVLANGDSIFQFNATHQVNQYGLIGSDLGRVNLYGGGFRWNAATGVAQFHAAMSSVIAELRTAAAVGQSWALTPTVQATLTSRALDTVLTQPDTVATIALSDGNTLRLSRRFGLISGPDFTYYLGRTYRESSPNRIHRLQLAGLPEAGLPGLDLTGNGIYDFAPGDSLFYVSHDQGGDGGWCIPPVSCGSSYDYTYSSAVVVRSRQFSAAGDTMIVTVSDITTSGAGSTYSLLYARNLVLLTGALSSEISSGRPLLVLGITQHPDSMANVPRVLTRLFIPDAGWEETFAPGLGTIQNSYGYTYCCYSHHSKRLTGFYKSQTGLSWGRRVLPRPLAAPSEISLEAPTLVPNPATTAATLRLSLPSAGSVQLRLFDGLGRLVWQQTNAQPAGEVSVAIPTAGLPAGLYHLRIAGAARRSTTLPLVKAD